MTGTRLRSVVAIAGIALLLGCDAVEIGGSGVCAEVGARCSLPDGPVGVCERSPCEGGSEPPCYTCTPQH